MSRAVRFPPLSLSRKLTLLISVLIISTCVGLSWYLIHQHTSAIHHSLIRTSTLLAERLSLTSRFSIISQDVTRLDLLSDGALTIPEVAYVRFLKPDGTVLYERQKPDTPVAPLQPTLTASPPASHTDPLVTPFRDSSDGPRAMSDFVSTEALMFMAVQGRYEETILDVLQPITNVGVQSRLAASLLDDLEVITPRDQTASSPTSRLYGYIQLGVSAQMYEQALLHTIQQGLAMTFAMIAFTLFVTIVSAGRMIKPLQHLASLASQVARGDLRATAPVTTEDEIGALGDAFNQMVYSLKQRDAALTSQLTRLNTLNKASATISASLDPGTVLDRVLDLLVRNLGFQRTLLMLYDPERKRLHDARIAGVSTDVAAAARTLSIPITNDGTLPSTLVQSGKAVLIHDLETAAHPMHPALLELAKQMDASSLLLVPLRSQQRVIGIAGACSGPVRSTKEDLELLSTIGRHIGAAIDNAQTYRQLETMMETLEQRVQDRTAALRAANEKLKELDRLKSSVVTRVSHELRTPLASIKMHVDNVLDGAGGPIQDRQKDCLTRVRNNAERLRRIINEMLDLSRIESGRTSLSNTVVMIPHVVEEVRENLEPLATSRRLRIVHHDEPRVPPVWADEDKLHQVLMNLLHNAVKFSPPDSAIEVSSRVTDNEQVEMCVSDQGLGIDASELERIFLPFYRPGGAPNPHQGAGLGLAISRGLIEMHGGTLWVQSRAGEGCRFFFTLPIAQVPTTAPAQSRA